MKHDVTAEVSEFIEGTPHEVWAVLTDPKLIPRYFMGATVETSWEVGTPITFHGEWKETTYEDKGEILAFHPERQLRFSHWSSMGGTADLPENYHVVTFDLLGEGPGTLVTLSQSNLNGEVSDDDRAHRASYEANWEATVRGLKGLVEA
jgi:uncharacterized protein YndB with AHSA1/START domain